MSCANEAHDQGETWSDKDDEMPYLPPPSPPKKEAISLLDRIEEHDVDAITTEMSGLFAQEEGIGEEDSDEADESDHLGHSFDETSDEEYAPDDLDSSESSYEEEGPDTWIRDQFKGYCEHACRNFLPLTEKEVTSARLLHLLKEKKAPLNAYESVMLWHLKESKQVRQQETLQNYSGYISRKKLLNKLKLRYNYQDQFPFQRTTKLPVSGTIVKITCHNTKAVFQRLLTDPRIEPKDYLFWDNNPKAFPPENLDYVRDLNTGQAYLQTHARLITKAGEQLMPVIIYTDGTPVSHFHDMEIIQVKMSLGIMTRVARLKPHCWATLGYIEKIHQQGGRGRKIVEEANHLETQDAGSSVDSDETLHEMDGVGVKNDQDFHAMMDIILQDFVRIQERGFLWDHHDPVAQQTYEGINYKTFTPFIRCDTKEADLLAAKYGQRFSAQQICRKCHIPLQEADDHLAKYKFKTVSEIKKLVENADLDGLKALSQTYLKNTFHKVRFSMGNDCGIHGSCPSELLHAFLLGTFKYLRDIFFEFIGKDSERAKLINALAKVYGKHFARQSDRTMPGTAFSRGIQAGKLMAKDFRGILLIMCAILRSTKGREILSKRNNFWETTALDDWILLVELMLEWESYLNEPQMCLKHVKRLEKKHRFIMYIMRKVAQRTQGMGLKLMKFHAILHIWKDIIQFGLPLEYDTAANESMHKPAKQAAKQTQMAADTFNFQTGTRLIEYDLLDLAMEEIENNRVPWQYFWNLEESESDSDEDNGGGKKAEISTGETKIQVYVDNNGEASFKLYTRSKHWAKTRWNTCLVEFLLELQDKIQAYIRTDSLPIYTCHRRDGQIFRGHPNYRGKGAWKDWVWVNWGEYGKLPCHIWCFVVLQGMPTGQNALYHGGIPLKDGTYAVVETTTLQEDEDEIGKSDLMMPVMKEVTLDAAGNVENRTFYLADTEAFLDPCCTVPDLGGPTNRYFVVLPRNEWAKLFVKWVEDPHNLDEMDPLDSVEEDDDVMNILEEERPIRKRK